ncbi:putative transporter [Neolecta irregularis DAH-3]|uniref:Putative transporter n=1 Tax=Neolecta irregularis (strain DAH-3) TaxID=1198029 RepID=A0A1U7LU19_NEOID|nr:putative transporter [Neolecta irregularis DAH-3]|eukprot:OLL26157.1 putative transporter [Neolecta irregularis DAH-3]
MDEQDISRGLSKQKSSCATSIPVRKSFSENIGIHPFVGIINDIKRRAPFYVSDWTDAWDYRIVPASIYMFFANILPAVAFALDLVSKTDSNYGVNEVLLSSVIAAVAFSMLGGQPLCIVGVTGPITVFNYTIYDIVHRQGVPYLPFMGWVSLWGLIFHLIIAIFNGCNFLKYVTRFSCDTFGFYVAMLYLQKGFQILTRQFEDSEASGYLSITLALLVFIVGCVCQRIGSSNLFKHVVRILVLDYGTPLTIIFFTGLPYIGRMRYVGLKTLPVSQAFQPTLNRNWVVDFWTLDAVHVFEALPFGILLTILFWFDHNVSCLIAQGSEFPLKKPAAFHYDMSLLGIVVLISGLLGIPAPNGLIPQAPFHTASLCVTTLNEKNEPVIERVVEQRASNLLQGFLSLIVMTGPLLTVLHKIPQAVLAGLFWVMGVDAILGNGITRKIIWLCTQNNFISQDDPLRLCRSNAVYKFVALELLGFGATFAITQTIAASGFPVIIMSLIPLRIYLCPKLFTFDELDILDAPTASKFTMVSVGGMYEAFGHKNNSSCTNEELEIQEANRGVGLQSV